MVDDGKKKFTVDLALNPFIEFKSKKAPLWFELGRGGKDPKKHVQEIVIKRTLELCPKKWKQKMLDEGVYAVARYDLAQFATALNALQKNIAKVIPKKEQTVKAVATRNKKEDKKVDTSLSVAKTKGKKLYEKITKVILEKVTSASGRFER